MITLAGVAVFLLGYALGQIRALHWIVKRGGEYQEGFSRGWAEATHLGAIDATERESERDHKRTGWTILHPPQHRDGGPS